MSDPDFVGPVTNAREPGVDFLRLILGEIEPRDYAGRLGRAVDPPPVIPREMRVAENALSRALLASVLAVVATGTASVLGYSGYAIAAVVAGTIAAASGATVLLILLRSAAAVELTTVRGERNQLRAASDRSAAFSELLLDAQVALSRYLTGAIPVSPSELTCGLMDAAQQTLCEHRRQLLSLVLRSWPRDDEPRLIHVAGDFAKARGSFQPSWRPPSEYAWRGQEFQLLALSQRALDKQERRFVDHLGATLAVLLRDVPKPGTDQVSGRTSSRLRAIIRRRLMPRDLGGPNFG